jgi:hypothetical protein
MKRMCRNCGLELELRKGTYFDITFYVCKNCHPEVYVNSRSVNK